MSAARAARGTMSLSISIHLPLNDDSMLMNPVMLPPGRGRLATNPLPTGSETDTNTIGIVLVSRCSAATTCVVAPTIRSGCRLTNSFAGLQGIEWVILGDHSGGNACG